jgi:hypothetical protein
MYVQKREINQEIVKLIIVRNKEGIICIMRNATRVINSSMVNVY